MNPLYENNYNLKKSFLQAEDKSIEEKKVEKPSLRWLLPKLREEILKKGAEKIEKAEKRTVEASEGKISSIKAKTLGQPSQNPVGIVSVPHHVLRSSLQRQVPIDFEDFVKEIENAKSNCKGPPTLMKTFAQILDKLLKEIDDIYKKVELSPQEKSEQAYRLTLQVIGDLNSKPALKKLKFDLSGLQNITSPISQEESDKIPSLYNKEEIANQLRIELQRLKEKDRKGRKEIISFLKELYSSSDPFIYKESLVNKVNSSESDIPNHLIDVLKKILTNKSMEYVSTLDLQSYLGKRTIIRKLNEELNKYSNQDYVIKSGIENIREILAGRLLEELGMNDYFLPKTYLSLPHTEIEARQGSIRADEGVIGSKFLENENISSLKAAWHLYLKAKQDLEMALFLNKTAETIEDLRNKLEEAAQKVEEQGGTNSIPIHVLVTSLLGGFDDHISQYIKVDEELINIDFARFLSPSMAMKKTIRTRLENEIITEIETFFTFRSVFYDHPFADQPLPAKLVKTIKEWDLESLIKSLKDMVGDPMIFSKAMKEIETFIREINLSRENLEELKKLCDRHHIPYAQESTSKQLFELLKNKAEQKQMEYQRICFDKIHPQAFDGLEQRLRILKDYVENTEEPTAKEAFARMHPDIMPFMKVLARLVTGPGEAISINFGEKKVRLRALEEIIKMAETNTNSEGEKLATPEEIKAMKESLARLQENAAKAKEIRLTMNLNLFDEFKE